MLRVRPSSLTLGGVNYRRMVLEATRGYFHRNSTTRAAGWCTHSSSRLLSCLRCVHLRCSIVQSDKVQNVTRTIPGHFGRLSRAIPFNRSA